MVKNINEKIAEILVYAKSVKSRSEHLLFKSGECRNYLNILRDLIVATNEVRSLCDKVDDNGIKMIFNSILALADVSQQPNDWDDTKWCNYIYRLSSYMVERLEHYGMTEK